MSDVLLTERHDDGVAVLTINRPDKLNALNGDVIDALDRALGTLADEGVRAIVLTGAGGKAFVAGADIAQMASFTPTTAEAFALQGQRVLDQLSAYPGVTIAAVSGFALGGGLELAMACDLIVASEKARVGQPEVSLGVIPGFGGTQRLTRLVGPQVARDLCMTGRLVRADEMLRVGLAARVVPHGESLSTSLDIARSVLKQGPVAVAYAKRAVNFALDLDLAQGLRAEAALFGLCFATDDQTEGMSAMLEKRKPSFQGW